MWQYDRIDPAEMQSLKTEIEHLKAANQDIEKLTAEKDTRLAEQSKKVHISLSY